MAKRKTTAIFFEDLKEDAQKRIIAHEIATILDCEPDEVEVENSFGSLINRSDLYNQSLFPEYYLFLLPCKNFPRGSDSKESACNVETQVRSLGREDLLEKGMATHSSLLA